MSYTVYGYNPVFQRQMASPGFSQPVGYPAPMLQQNAPVAAPAASAGGFCVQPVTSREEALAVIADPMSAGVLLPDLSHGVIYLKRFNPNTGISDFGEFAFVPPKATPVESPAESGDFVTRKDFEAALAQLRSELTAKPAKRKETSDE